MHGKSKKDRTFSKKVLVFDYILAVILVAVAVVYTFHNDSYSNPIASMVEVWVAQCGVVTAFYLWKSKCENRNKYMQEWVTRLLKEDDIPPEKLDAIVRIGESVTRD